MKVALQLALLCTIAATGLADSSDEELGLHSDGGVWKFYASQERDERLPDVLLIGDSIMGGYRDPVIRRVKSHANVDCWLTPMHLNSRDLHRQLKQAVSRRDYAVVHFNIGLHGWQDGRIPKGRYRELLETYVAILKEHAPNAQLIWATTTQVHKEGTQELDTAINPIVVRRNKNADAVMRQTGVVVNDLYHLMSDHLDLVRGDRWHWQQNAYEIMARQVAQMIDAALEDAIGSAPGDQEIKIYASPEGIELSETFSLTVGDREAPVHNAKVPVSESIPRLNRSIPNNFGLASFASFDMRTDAALTVTCQDPVQSVKILPSSLDIVPRVDGRKIAFTLDAPRHVTVEVNGDWHESLHIFANPIEEDIPDPDDPNVVFFGPGIHEVTSLTVKDNTTVYLAGGAIVRCEMDADQEPVQVAGRRKNPPTFLLHGKNITLRGRGIIEGGTIVSREDRRHVILVQDSENVTIEGVIIHDPSHWTVPIHSSQDVHVDNIKILGLRGNSDGVDICSSRDVLVENCFLRTFDDLIVIKSHTDHGQVKNVHVRNCVLWNELAHALSIGAELRENVSNVLFEDCDIIHDVGRETALRIYHCDDAVISDITFQNIRVEEARRLISCWIGKTRWTKTEGRGHIRNVIFRNITADSAPIDPALTGFQDGPDWKPYVLKDHASIVLVGFDKDHLVEGVLFDNVVLDKKKVKKKHVTTNEFVKDVRFE